MDTYVINEGLNEKDDLRFVFQYGSNMSSARFQERIPETQPVEAAWTVDLFQFAFPVWSREKKRAVSGIIADKSGRCMFGALFLVPSDLIDRESARSDRKTLDEYEGEGKNYRRDTIEVIGRSSGRKISAITYLPIPQLCERPTDWEYAGFILAGLREWNAPASYMGYFAPVLKQALERGGTESFKK